jgi:hypothetical protein
MRLQRHRQVRPRRRTLAECTGDFAERGGDLLPAVGGIHPDQRRDLVVSRTRGVNFPPRVAGVLGQLQLDEGVQILDPRIRARRSAELRLHPRQGAHERLQLRIRDDSGGIQGPGVAALQRQLIRQKEPVVFQTPV